MINKEVYIFIEDRVKNATEISEKEICVLLIDRPWNQHAVENKYLARADSWDFIKDFYYRRCSKSRLLFKKF